MAAVHTAFLREFFAMPELVRAVPDGDQQRAVIVADHIALFIAGLHGHHEGEDVEIWPRLLERCAEEIRPLVHGMERHHALIAAGIDALSGAAARWRSDAGAEHRAVMESSLDDLLPILRQHLTDEIDYVLPLIEKYISDDEWAALGAHSRGTMPAEALPLIFGIVMYEAEPHVIDEMLAELPEEARAALAGSAPRAYAEYAERLYGTSSPARWSTSSSAG
ncbi:hemerythrin domain-containing protein [Actinoplanes sp. TBRC 11911]|uniref:hemerythrin domain-containing protein n=1 Tax=Actinoplanes sp. TBRC 11911 TaxID=2729386 RepID=UPI00145C8809|nr:hemerythrin domain-containing protein [Actinoplanes sp. TBRC 11911]NMO49941.1 hemerythrin domain-containing protein [Actinoplanes sp. TBRC 11911]